MAIGSFNNPITGAGGELVREVIHSDNFVPATSGWAVYQDGSAEFHDVTLTGGSLIIEGTGEGVFLYSGPPAPGNLIGSFASAAGSDYWGNHFVEGLGFYNPAGPVIEVRPDLTAMLVYQG